jgi:3-hydroxybutyryl-CoA dehydratase
LSIPFGPYRRGDERRIRNPSRAARRLSWKRTCAVRDRWEDRVAQEDSSQVGQAFEKISEGDSQASSRVVSDHDIEMFAAITGDHNPIHLQSDFAQTTIFKSKIAHGILVAGLISAAISKFPGLIVYLSQSLSFRKPVRPGDEIEATARVVEKNHDRHELTLDTVCRNQRGEVVISGEAKVRVFEHDLPDPSRGESH